MSSLSTNHVISLPQLEQTNCIANGGSTLKEEIADKLRISPDDVFNVFDLSKIKSDSSLEKGLVELTNIQTGSLLLQKIVKLAKDNSKKISLSCDGPKCEFNLKELKLSIPDDAFSDKKHPFLVKTDDGNFGIVKVAPPPAQVLAHELGHVLHFLEAGADVNTTEILENKTMEMLCAEYRYGQILGDIKIQADSFGYDPSNMSGSGAGLFLDMWNHANYTEIINILPEELFLDKSGLRDIIPKGTTIKKQWDRSTQQVNLPHIPKRGFRISDGIILREIVEYRAKIKMEQPKFYDSGDEEIDGNAMATNFIASRPESI
ncbi:MAG: hypothetical protein LBT64_03495, partial [Puniceicoccales bacterium]|nr:hypothetical protein [Puniceicoccales bacterium]